MDEYTEQYTPIDFDFKDWVLHQTSPRYTIAHNAEDKIELQTDYATVYINFYDLGIVEISIVSNKDQKDHYNLHFQLNDEEHAKKLFREMVQALYSLEDQKEVRVLLSCSGGLTSSFFAQKLNDEAKERGLHMHFDAVGFNQLYEEAPNYDILLLAPQIGYQVKKLKAAFPQKSVAMIPTAMFASFNAPDALKFIHDELNNTFKEAESTEDKPVKTAVREKNAVVAVIGIVSDFDRARHYYRVYDHGKIVLNEETVKPFADWQDTDDILNILTTRFPNIDLIGIAVPGVILDGKYIELPYESHSVLLRTYKFHVEHKYNIPCILANNSNASAVGFHLHHPEYHSLMYFSQPYGDPIGGQGYIVHDKLVTGTKGQAGEYKFFINRMQFSDDPAVLAKTDTGMLELVTKALLPPICILGIEAAAIRSSMTPDMNELKKQVSKFIPEEFLPKFHYVEDARDYILEGMYSIALDQERLKKEEEK